MNQNHPTTIAIDFDGTCVKHKFPDIGDSIGAEEILRELVKAGHKLILFTMRSDVLTPVSPDGSIINKSGNYLTEAVRWFKERDIPLYGINANPTQSKWTHSPKAYAELYIDDAALGIPLLQDSPHERPYVNWVKVRELLVDRGIL
jgi:hypothetical protein